MADEPIKKDPNDPTQRLTRAEAMEIVQANRIKNLYEKEINENPQTPESVAAASADPEDAESNLDPGAQLETQLATPQLLADDDLAKYMVRTKVNGEERMVPLTELRATAQKTDAAETYLRDAREQARQILEDARKAAATPAAVPATATPETTPKEPAKPAEYEGMLDSAIDEMFKGNIDESKRLFKEAARATRSADQPSVVQPDLDQLASTVEQKVVVRSALRQFAKDYPGIYADPVARKVADSFLSEATEGKPLEGFPEEKIGEILNKTGKRVLDWTRGLAGVSADASSATTRTDKAIRKEGIDELPAANARATTVVSPPKTTTDIIRSMAASRGQLRDPTQP